jgi:arginase family enzyme
MSDALNAIEATPCWLHLDLDVLSSEAFAAVDYPQPGGLGWLSSNRSRRWLLKTRVVVGRASSSATGSSTPTRARRGT